MRRLGRLLGGWRRRWRLDADLSEELEDHLARKREALERDGLPPGEAAYAAMRALGNVALAREDARAIWGWPALESLTQDVRHAFRMLARNPWFGLAVIAVTGLGIGATVGVGGLLDALVLRPLPVREPSKLVYLGPPSFSYPVFEEVRSQGGGILESLFAWNVERLNVQWHDEVEPADVLFAGGAFYATLGINAAAGRLLTPDDDQMGGGRDGFVAVISHACWVRRFSADPAVVGRTIRIDRQPFTIVGITPRGFFGVAPGLSPDVTVGLTSLERPESLRSTSRSWVHVMGRLRPGVSLADANRAFHSLWPAVLGATAPAGATADRRTAYLDRRARLESGRTGFSRVRRRFAEPLWLLFALVTLLMVTACASTANLLLARVSARQREVAVRMAIGAGRRRVVRQLLTETTVWTSIGGAAGVLLASWGSAALVSMMSTPGDTLAIDATPSARTLSFALGLAILMGIACAAVPAWRITRRDTASSLKEASGCDVGLRRWSLNTTLVVAQVAFAIVLVVGAALFVRSLQRVLAEDAGFDRQHLLVVATDPVFAGYEGARLSAYYEQLAERLAATPGIESASVSKYPPLTNDLGSWSENVRAREDADQPGDGRVVSLTTVTPGHFRTLGVPLLEGRDFGGADDASAPDVVIVNHATARALFGAASPLGRQITIGRGDSRREPSIVGVVGDSKYQHLQEPRRYIAYLPYRQHAAVLASDNQFAQVRTAGAPAGVVDAIRQQVRELDPAVPIRIESMADRVRASVVTERVLAALAFALGVTALALASASLFGLLAYAVTRRTREIGVRMALGAERREVVGLVLRECLVITASGMALGLAASLALGGFARRLLFEIGPSDPLSLAGACAVMAAVTLAAGAIPARRAARVEPVVALRHE
jgi:predicted permease